MCCDSSASRAIERHFPTDTHYSFKYRTPHGLRVKGLGFFLPVEFLLGSTGSFAIKAG